MQNLFLNCAKKNFIAKKENGKKVVTFQLLIYFI